MFARITRRRSKTLAFRHMTVCFTALLLAASSIAVFDASTGWAADESSKGIPGEGPRFCSGTAFAAFRACRHEVKDDYWIAVGNCRNLAERETRAECLSDAGAELKEAEKECKAQREARLEICAGLGEGPYDPVLSPNDFVAPPINAGNANRYFPLVAGTQWVYEGETEEGTETINVEVTGDIKEIEYPAESGRIFKCVAVRDVVTLDGRVTEDTIDWYAQDTTGNVWYFGEISQNFEDGELVDIEGSWKAGGDSAKPGIVMPADPRPEALYRQEFALGDAEDMASVVNRGTESVTVRFGPFDNDVLKTREFTPLEPDVFEHKYYAPGVGLILEVNPDTGERLELIEMTTP